MKRWKARTDLTYLAKEVLGYKDVIGPSRFPFMNILQKFPLPTFTQLSGNDRITGGKWRYTPLVPIYELPGHRKVLILDPRGFLKTTINAQTHTIQWILNYPDVAMIIIQSNSEKAEAILGEIKRHFQANQTLRALFPEHCPTKRPFDWGTKAAFTTEARGIEIARKEETLMTGSIDKGSAGYHFDVMKFSDIVEPNNVKTPEQIRSVIESFGMFENLLKQPDSWIDVEGTRYDFSDLYGELIKSEMLRRKASKDSRWKIHVRGVYKKETQDGEPEKFIPEELDYRYQKDEKGEKISWWPERWPTKLLEERRTDPTIGEYTFATQQLNNPTDVGDAQVAFPVNDNYPKWISRKNFRLNIRVVRRTVTVDSAETQNERSNLSAITVVAWDQSGRAYLDAIRAGKWLPDELVNQIFAVNRLFRPDDVKIESTGFIRGLMPTINRRMQTSGDYLPLSFIQRENKVTKQERIRNTLQPWYRAGDLRFLDDLDNKEDLIEELRRFPRYTEDDIIDSLADHFQGKEWFGREQARPPQGSEINVGMALNPWQRRPSANGDGAFVYDEEERAVIMQRAMDKLWKVETMELDNGLTIPLPGSDPRSRTGGL